MTFYRKLRAAAALSGALIAASACMPAGTAAAAPDAGVTEIGPPVADVLPAPADDIAAEPDLSAVQFVQMPAAPIPTHELEQWPKDPHENAKRTNGQLMFQARGHVIGFDEASAGIAGWAKSTFGDEATAELECGRGEETRQARASTKVCTGDKVHIVHKDGKVGTYDVVVRGDAAQNGTPGVTQLVHIVQTSKTDPSSQTATKTAAADIDGDGKVTISDAALQAHYLKTPHEDGPVLPDTPVHSAWETDNIGAHNYINANRWAAPTSSYLFDDGTGGLTRVEYAHDTVVVETYNKDLQIETSRQVPMELSKWGGFYAGSRYNYFVFGQDNMEENPDLEVIRIVQYSKDWHRIGATSLFGANTQSPFLAGSLRCTESGDYLYVHTCHNMMRNDEGVNHQANMMIEVDQDALKITETESGVVWGTGLVSHSFNQFVLTDQDGKLVILDHGDAYPRAVVLRRYLRPAGQDTFITGDGQSMEVESVEIQTLAGASGDNDTGCSLGGFAETANGYVSAFGYDEKGARHEPRDVFFAFTDRNDISRTTVTRLTMKADAQTPMIAPLSEHSGYLLWEQAADSASGRTLHYIEYNKNGKLGPRKTADAHLSDCEPIVWGDSLVWYVTDKGAPVFYVLSSDGVRAVAEA